MSFEQIITLILLLSAGFLLGNFTLWLYQRIKLSGFKNLGMEIIRKAELEAQIIEKNADLQMKKKQVELQQSFEEKTVREQNKLNLKEERIKEREDKLERRMGLVEKKLSDIEKKESIYSKRREQLEAEKHELSIRENQYLIDLEKVAGITSEKAKELLREKIEDEAKREAALMTKKAFAEADEECERIAITVLCTAINRLAVNTASESATLLVSVPNDEMKGRIVGRDGRNIRALERLTGVNFLIDESPGVVVISGFDPVRKHIARIALTELVNDGRIHPSRIEEACEKAKKTIQKEIIKYGEDAAMRSGATNLHPEIINLLGKLKLRYSYGQNVLDHSLEVSHLMGMMAGELGLDTQLSKRIGLLHDIGKAISHEIEGTHALIGRDLALKYGETKEVANGIGCHHNEIDPITPEGSLCGPADAISASRPGARVEAAQEYFKRLKALENIAYEFPGIEQAYALQAGREIRIVVLPDMIDDCGTLNLARDISKKIENEMRYPGKIKVTVIREKRAVEFAV